MQLLLAVEHPRRRLDRMLLRLDRRGLDHRPAERALSRRRPPSPGTDRPRRAARFGRRTEQAQAPRPRRLRRRAAARPHSRQARPRRSARRHAAGRRRAARGSADPCRRRRGNGSRRPCRSDRSRASSGVTSARSEKSSQVSAMPAAAAIATRWMVWLVEPPVASSPTMPLTIARSSMMRPIGANSLPRAVIASARLAPAGQRVAQRRVGIDEGRARQMQAHDLHQHLVGVGGAVEGAGAGRVVGLGLGLEQFGAARLALGVELADLRFLGVGEARGHRAGGHEHRRQMAERQRADQQAGHDLVADRRDRRPRRTCRARARPRSIARSRRGRTATAPCPARPG